MTIKSLIKFNSKICINFRPANMIISYQTIRDTMRLYRYIMPQFTQPWSVSPATKIRRQKYSSAYKCQIQIFSSWVSWKEEDYLCFAILIFQWALVLSNASFLHKFGLRMLMFVISNGFLSHYSLHTDVRKCPA